MVRVVVVVLLVEVVGVMVEEHQHLNPHYLHQQHLRSSIFSLRSFSTDNLVSTAEIWVSVRGQRGASNFSSLVTARDTNSGEM